MTDFTHPVSCLGNDMRRTSRAVTNHYEQALAPCGLRFTQFSVLVAIRELERPTVGALADTALLDRTTLTRTLELLRKAGYVAFGQGGDRRQRYIELTRQGADKLHEATAFWHGAQGQLVASLGTNRAEELRELLEAVRAAAATTPPPSSQ